MYDLQTLKALNARRVRQLQADNARKHARLIARIQATVAKADSLSLDSAADRSTLVRRLAGEL